MPVVFKKRVTFCPCCHEPVTHRQHTHMYEEAVRMLQANIEARRG